MATLGIGALAAEIRDIIAQSVGLGNAASLATHFAINPHCPLYYSNQQPVLPQKTLRPRIRPITLPSSRPITIAGPTTAPLQALKTAEVDDQHKRFTILCPNRDLIYLQPERPVSVLLHRADRAIRLPGAHLPAGPRHHR